MRFAKVAVMVSFDLVGHFHNFTTLGSSLLSATLTF